MSDFLRARFVVWGTWFTLAGLAVLYAAPAQVEAALAMFSAKDFGAVGDGKTDDGPAIRRALAAAVATEKPAEVMLEKKTYRIGQRDDRWDSFALQGVRELTFDGKGATLVFSPNNRAFLLDGCHGCTLSNMEIDFDPLPFTQGDVLKVDLVGQSFDVKLHDGYPDPPTQEWMLANYGPYRGWWTGTVLAADSRTFPPRIPGGFITVESVQRLRPDERIYRIGAKGDAAKLPSLVVGDRFAFRVRYATKQRNDRLKGLPSAGIQICHSADCTLRNIRQYCSPDMWIHLWDDTGQITIDGCQIVYKPGTNRLVTSLSDGIHCKSDRVGPLIQNCIFEGLMDDSINIGRMADIVQQVSSEKVFRVCSSEIAWYDDSLETGDLMEAMDMATGVILSQAKVVKIDDRQGHVRTITVDRPIRGVTPQKDPADGHCTWFFDLSACGNRFIIRNNMFRAQMRSAMVLRASGLIENNEIDDAGGLGIYLTNDLPPFPEGPAPRDVIVRGNTIRNTHYQGIHVGAASFNENMPPLARNVLIEGNSVALPRDNWPISLFSARDIVLKRNTLKVAAGHEAIVTRNCLDIREEGNTIIRDEDLKKEKGGGRP